MRHLEDRAWRTAREARMAGEIAMKIVRRSLRISGPSFAVQVVNVVVPHRKCAWCGEWFAPGSSGDIYDSSECAAHDKANDGHDKASRALAKTIACKQAGNDAAANIWAIRLVKLLKCDDILADWYSD
jgi:hypothetical protein